MNEGGLVDRRTFQTLVIGLRLVASLVGASGMAAEVVLSPDPALEAAIREAMDKPTGDSYEHELAEISEIAAYSSGIVSLEGIQCCKSLQRLTLSYNQIVDVSPLAGLANLDHLYLHNNKSADIIPPGELTGLGELYLFDNKIEESNGSLGPPYGPVESPGIMRPWRVGSSPLRGARAWNPFLNLLFGFCTAKWALVSLPHPLEIEVQSR